MPRLVLRRVAVLLWLVSLGCSESALQAASCPPGSRDVQGQCIKLCRAQTDCLATEDCFFDTNDSVGLCGPASRGPTQIRRFTVTPTTIDAGDSVAVGYAVVNARSVELLLREADGSEILFHETNDDFVAVVNSPSIDADVNIVLQATGPLGQVVTDMFPVDVRGTGELNIELFKATPEIVLPGETTTLSWRVLNSVGPILVTREDKTDIVMSDGEPIDSVDVVVDTRTTFTLYATGADEQEQSDTVTVQAQNVVLDSFFVVPDTVQSGDGAILTWQTRGADRITLFGTNDAQLYESTDPDYVTSGRFLVLPEESTTSYTIVASGGLQSDEGTQEIEVIPAPVATRIDSFVVSPNVLRESGPVNFSWNVTPANSEIGLFLAGVQVPVINGNGHTAQLTTDNTIVADLIVDSPAGVAAMRRRVWVVDGEDEPNNTPVTAQFGANDLAVEGELAGNGADDEDWFGVSVPEGGSVRATFLQEAGCSADFLVELWSGTRLAFEESRPGECPELFVNNLEDGPHLIRLLAQDDGPVLSYLLGLAVDGPDCGDGVEARFEQCDDGNRLSGDGCSVDCELEPDYNYFAATSQSTTWESAPAAAVPLPLLPYDEGQVLPASDHGFGMVQFPFRFRFYGRSYVGVVVHADGYMAFQPDLEVPLSEPGRAWGPTRPNAGVALLLTDLDWGNRQPRIWVERDPDRPLEIVWIDFEGVQLKNAPVEMIQARVGFTSEGRIRVRYGNVPSGLSFFSGVEDQTGTYQFTLCEANAGRCTNAQIPSNSSITYQNTALSLAAQR